MLYRYKRTSKQTDRMIDDPRRQYQRSDAVQRCAARCGGAQAWDTAVDKNLNGHYYIDQIGIADNEIYLLIDGQMIALQIGGVTQIDRLFDVYYFVYNNADKGNKFKHL